MRINKKFVSTVSVLGVGLILAGCSVDDDSDSSSSTSTTQVSQKSSNSSKKVENTNYSINLLAPNTYETAKNSKYGKYVYKLAFFDNISTSDDDTQDQPPMRMALGYYNHSNALIQKNLNTDNSNDDFREVIVPNLKTPYVVTTTNIDTTDLNTKADYIIYRPPYVQYNQDNQNTENTDKQSQNKQDNQNTENTDKQSQNKQDKPKNEKVVYGDVG